jgi:hypothetical protein
MGARSKKKRHADGVDTWIHVCNEIIHHVLPYRSRTVHFIWAVTIPPAALIGAVLTVSNVLVPHPYGWFGVTGCGVGVFVVARARLTLMRLRDARRRVTTAHADGVPATPESADRLGEETAEPTNQLSP